MFRRISDNLRRDIPEAKKFIYPSDVERLTGEKAKNIGVDIANTIFNIPNAGRSLGRIAEEVGDILGRRDATPAKHKSYLDNKYGKTNWDVYKDRGSLEQRNPDFHYNKQDLGNGNVYIQRESKRFAGQTLSDEWLEDIRAHGIEQDMLEERVELNRQEQGVRDYFGDKVYEAFVDLKNPSRSAEQQLSRALLYDGQTNPIIQPDRMRASDVNQPDNVLGIDDRYMDDSEIRGEVTATINPDGTYNLERTGVTTEILSPEGQDAAYEAWEQGNIRKSSGLQSFNEAAGEYYGQQALRMAGAKPVKDDDRTWASQRAAYSEDGANKTTTGTDRLIEHTRSLSSGAINSYEPADYRFVGTDGKIHAYDYQVGNTNPSGELSMNLFKASELRPGDERRFISSLQREAQLLGTSDFDTVMKSLAGKGVFGEMQTSQAAASRSGFRSGKLTSDAPYMGQANLIDNNTAYEGVLYGLTDPKRRNKQGGYIPDQFVMLQGEDARNEIGRQLLEGRLEGRLFIDPEKGSVNITMSNPNSYSMLDKNQARIIQEPYALDKPMPRREPMVMPEPELDLSEYFNPNIDATGNLVNMEKIREGRRTRQAPKQIDMSKLSAQERYELKQIELQRHFGGPRVDHNWQGRGSEYYSS